MSYSYYFRVVTNISAASLSDRIANVYANTTYSKEHVFLKINIKPSEICEGRPLSDTSDSISTVVKKY